MSAADRLQSLSAPAVYLVRYVYDDKASTPGECRTDYRCAPGELIYAQHGRATVTACRLDHQSTDDTWRRNGRTLHALSLPPVPGNS